MCRVSLVGSWCGVTGVTATLSFALPIGGYSSNLYIWGADRTMIDQAISTGLSSVNPLGFGKLLWLR